MEPEEAEVGRLLPALPRSMTVVVAAVTVALQRRGDTVSPRPLWQQVMRDARGRARLLRYRTPLSTWLRRAEDGRALAACCHRRAACLKAPNAGRKKARRAGGAVVVVPPPLVPFRRPHLPGRTAPFFHNTTQHKDHQQLVQRWTAVSGQPG